MKEAFLINKELVKGLISGQRDPDTDKRDYGDLLIFAGKEGMAGAAILAAKAALRSGVGLVKLATPKSNFPIIQRVVPEAICIEEESALSNLRYCTAIVIGPGMGADERTERIVANVLEEAPICTPILIDADGLNVIALRDELRSACRRRGAKPTDSSGKCGKAITLAGAGPLVITPHKREAARLLGCESIDAAERKAACVKLAETFNCVALLKGSGTLIASGEVYQNTTGNPGMATAGSGDVLSGVIGAFLAQGMSAGEAAIAGAYIHGLAGDLVAENIGERSLMASDIIDALPEVFKRL